MKHRRRKLKLKFKAETIYTIFQVGLFLFAVLLFLSFSQQGVLLLRLNEEITKIIGWGIYLLPFLLISYSLLFSRIKSKFTKPNITIGATFIWIALLGLTKEKAGLVGQEIFRNIEAAITTIGAYLFLVCAFLIGLVIFFNTSIDEVVIFVTGSIGNILKFLKKILKKPSLDKNKALFSQTKLPIEIKGLKDYDDRKEIKKPPLGEIKKDKTILEPQLGTTLVSNAPGEQIIWEYPPLSLLAEMPSQKADRGDIKWNANTIERTLESFGILAKVKEINKGPAVTQYALEIALGTKLSKITALSNDLALALAAPTGQIRIEAPIPGRSLVGIEIPNRSLQFVTLKEMLESDVLRKSKSKLTVALGLDVSGTPIVADLAKMPHILIAGSTGSGKSVCINAFIASLLYRCSPQELKLILVDPKRVELSLYNDIPHLMIPVIVDHEKIISSLKWAMNEMDRRYKQFAQAGARNIEAYNEMAGFQSLPYIVIIIDELADIMMISPAEVEDAICRIAQMARATGIHLVVSTQRPSVNVITGLIKANIPCRVSFNVTSMIDSRVIIDMPGAEKLLGRGDMLYIPPDQSKPTRIQGAYVSDKEIEKLVTFLKSSGVPVEYTQEITSMPVGMSGKISGTLPTAPDGRDPLFSEAVRIVCQHDRASASLLQRRLSIGYARAARIIDQLEESGLVGPGDKSKPRDVIIKNAEEFLLNLNSASPATDTLTE